eukprot:4860529-Pyramimonas_sp.AAC.1
MTLGARHGQKARTVKAFEGQVRWSVDLPPPSAETPVRMLLTSIDHAVREQPLVTSNYPLINRLGGPSSGAVVHVHPAGAGARQRHAPRPAGAARAILAVRGGAPGARQVAAQRAALHHARAARGALAGTQHHPLIRPGGEYSELGGNILSAATNQLSRPLVMDLFPRSPMSSNPSPSGVPEPGQTGDRKNDALLRQP